LRGCARLRRLVGAFEGLSPFEGGCACLRRLVGAFEGLRPFEAPCGRV
jgi:hypothetical protein